mmetsp:Transcript_9457/g.18106  ORF Transcript_9457/g.18106 Transcript_9457/m.18106 type:complete len:241 (-) Transcript_9457:668-1390(-)|eukprot:CAMPEP_0172839872 /NCGR_PEP_ID=MMETSP1075-20121228/28886_1 /TAXON_ID=2916 /ORGANISM="Ceratium fusus, Strain PA161109" /LENGTH=240 /DNA_ID=CAMNT_0013683597 /DNA_START=73 /DNA_END=795 /DNA_ORIENTATION=+
MAVAEEVEVEEVETEQTKAKKTKAKKDADAESGDEDEKQKPKDSAETVAPAAAPAAPAAPEFKLSQIIPMVAMMGLQKFNLEEMGYVHHVEVGYAFVQVVCLALCLLIYLRIDKMVDDGRKIRIPEVKQMGQVVSPAKEQTAKEYDMDKLKEMVKQPLLGTVITAGIYYKWGSLMPLVMQLLMTPFTLYEGPLTQIHLLGKTMERPFPTPPGPFAGLMPDAPADEPKADEPKAVTKKKDE